MKLLNAQQLKAADLHTMTNEPIASIDLMERAAMACCTWLEENLPLVKNVAIFCGTGNNGGDGLAIARLLHHKGVIVHCFEIPFSSASEDYIQNKKRLPIPLTELNEGNLEDAMNSIQKESLVIDAVFGSGLNRSVKGLAKEVIRKINLLQADIVSIDLPSGLFVGFNTDNPPEGIVNATYTLSFQRPKLSFLLPDSGQHTGKFYVLDIGLDENFIEECDSPYSCITKAHIQKLLTPSKNQFVHKGTFGHLFLVSGKEGSMGAVVLAAKAALHSGLGKLSIIAPRCGLHILQTTVIEAMVEPYGETVLEGTYLPKGSCFAIGPGIGQDKRTVKFLEGLFCQLSEPIILDADALNILSQQPTLLNSIPKNSILTPHPKEFERLVGAWNNDEQKIQKLLDFSKKYHVYILLKGAYTAIACPEGNIYFNTTGNPGLATAGSGDVLTGLLGSFLAQGFAPLQSAQLGAFIHGKAGDEVEKETTARVLTAAMLPNAFAKVFKWLN